MTVVHLSPAQGRLARVLREQQAFLIRSGVTGFRFSSAAADRAWGKALRKDTVAGLVAANVLEIRRTNRIRVEFHLKAAEGAVAPEVGQ